MPQFFPPLFHAVPCTLNQTLHYRSARNQNRDDCDTHLDETFRRWDDGSEVIKTDQPLMLLKLAQLLDELNRPD
jgi:hypothetical protein